MVGKENVLRFDVSVDDGSIVDIGHSFQQTFHDAAGFKITKWFRVRLGINVFEESLELAANDELHLKDDEFLVLEDSLKCDYARMAHVRHNG